VRVVAGLKVVSSARGLAGDVAAVGFVDEDCVERQEPLEDCAQQGFESGPPVRTFPSFRGQRNWPGAVSIPVDAAAAPGSGAGAVDQGTGQGT
jgi:hypothetical protein